jgi:hypothetical protein
LALRPLESQNFAPIATRETISKSEFIAPKVAIALPRDELVLYLSRWRGVGGAPF